LFEETAARMRHEPAAFSGVSDIARACGLRRTALNELFREHAHESPAAFLRRVRLEYAMRQLAEGARPAGAASGAGFDSASVFHVHFVARTGLTPAAYADLSASGEFDLRLPPRYRQQEALRFFGRDAASVSERAEPDAITKCVLIDGVPAVLKIQFSEEAVARCTTDARDVFAAHRIAVRMLGLDSGAGSFEREFTVDKLLGSVFRNQRGLRIPMTPEPWEALAWAICGQQISVKAAVALRRELIAAAGTPHSSGLRAHPTAAQVAAMSAEQLRGLKFSRSKADYMLAAARAVASGEVPLERMREISAVRAARMLKAVRGIGDWTVQYTFLRGLGFTDSLPAGDVGLARGLETVCDGRPDEPRIREIMERYSPWRSYATYHVWSSLKGAGE
jgi:AraC family transcriptional regulator of adaptative response / DNA-3-methyladenine glycosylase II